MVWRRDFIARERRVREVWIGSVEHAGSVCNCLLADKGLLLLGEAGDLEIATAMLGRLALVWWLVMGQQRVVRR